MIYISHIHYEINTRVYLRADTNDPMDPYNFMILDDIMAHQNSGRNISIANFTSIA